MDHTSLLTKYSADLDHRKQFHETLQDNDTGGVRALGISNQLTQHLNGFL
jgi:hypothetical protein